jgi:hypothetical protein
VSTRRGDAGFDIHYGSESATNDTGRGLAALMVDVHALRPAA